MVDAVEEGGRHYLVMEYVAGGSLEDLLGRQGRLAIERVVEIGLDLADTLTRAHHLDIIRRNLKLSTCCWPRTRRHARQTDFHAHEGGQTPPDPDGLADGQCGLSQFRGVRHRDAE